MPYIVENKEPNDIRILIQMEKILLNSRKYSGQYVALQGIEDSTVIASGKTPAEALKNAANKGVDSPYLLYVPAEESVHIY